MPDRSGFNFYQLLPDGRYEFFVDATLLRNFSMCERYFKLRHVDNLRQKTELTVKPFAMAIGCWWSDVMEQFYNNLRDSRPVTDDDIKDFTLKAWVRQEINACAAAQPDDFAQFGDIAGAVLMLKQYHESQYQTDYRSWTVVSVEQGFGLNKEVLVGETNKVVVFWIGKPDLVVIEQNRIVPVDHKTVTRIDARTTKRYKPSLQMPGYAFSCEVIARSVGIHDARVDRCVVNICARAKPTENRKTKKLSPRFIRAYPNFTREEISEWRRDVVNKCERIAFCLEHNDWSMSETSCHNMYHRECPFLDIDAVTPSAREVVLMSKYVTSEPWVPYKKDGGE